jgi:protease IV
MKDFFKFMFASMLGFIIVLVVLFFIFLGLIASIISIADNKAVTIDQKTLLHLKLDKPIFDRSPKDPLAFFSPAGLDMNQEPGLDEILKNIEKAKSDPNIEGIYLDLGYIPSGIVTIREIREALVDFKTSGKFIIAYGEAYAQSAYFLASAADKVFLHPDGAIEFKGLAAEVFFLKGTLEKLDINMQVIRHGKYKSAVEIFTLDKMSEASHEQLDAMISDMWMTVLNDISASRNLGPDQLNLLADNLDALDAEKALSAKMVDGLYYKDEVNAELRNRLGLGEKDRINLISLSKYSLVPPAVHEKVSGNKIAVVYAIGNIVDGKGDDRTIGSVQMSDAIRQARESDKVKAIVLRVNSPGGSATASEVIRREVELAARVKPVVVSMGDVAASGGYWISASGTKILADPSTITGSIGVFGLIPNMQEFFEDKLGITFDQTMTNKYSDFPNINRPLSDYEIVLFERQIDKIYKDFLELVSAGRRMQTAQVDSVGQGRVWSGSDALEKGLIDQFGGLQDAIRLAAELASVTEYNLWSLPAQKDPWQQIIDELTGNVSTARIENELGEYYTYYQYLKQIKEVQGIQARLPFEIRVR